VTDQLCPAGDLDAALAPYRALLAQVDLLCARIGAAFPAEIKCRAGCATCCTLQGVLPVEAASLALACRRLPAADGEALRARLQAAADADRCPLLTDDCCPLYAARPIICRTHGLPLLVEDEHGRRVDRCPLNFTGLATLPGSAIIALETLNQALVVANRHFLATCFAEGGIPERIALRDVGEFLDRQPQGRPPWPT
jgi:Fe-S-cluster containining protein